MRLDTEYFPNKDMVDIHANEQITEIGVRSDFDYDSGKNNLHILIQAIRAHVKGVTYVSLHRYSVTVGKGSAFSWETVLPGVRREIVQYINNGRFKPRNIF